MKQEIPQDVWNEVVRLTRNKFHSEFIRELIEAAQLPIAPATKKEVIQAMADFYQPRSVISMERVLNQFISRRNSPPQVDPRHEKILAVLEHEWRDPNRTAREILEVLDAAAVREREAKNG